MRGVDERCVGAMGRGELLGARGQGRGESEEAGENLRHLSVESVERRAK